MAAPVIFGGATMIATYIARSTVLSAAIASGTLLAGYVGFQATGFDLGEMFGGLTPLLQLIALTLVLLLLLQSGLVRLIGEALVK